MKRLNMDTKATENKTAVKAKRLFDIIRARMSEADFSNTSIAVSYYLLLALFPFVILLGTLLPYLNIDTVTILEYMRIPFPEPIWNLIAPIIENLLTAPNPELFLVSLLAFSFAAIQGVKKLYRGLTKAYGIEKRPVFWANQAIVVAAIIVVLGSLFVFILLFVFGEIILDALSPIAPWTITISTTLWTTRGYIAALFLFVLFCLLYRLLTRGDLKLKEVWPGAAITTIGLVILSQAFAIYAQFAANSLAIYGAISIFFVLMVWLNFSTTLIMMGMLLNASIREYRNTDSAKRPSHKGE